MIRKLGLPPKQSTKKSPQKHFRVAEVDLPSCEFSGRLIQDPTELETFIPAWNRLVEMALCPNLFFDPDFLIPAQTHLADQNVSVLVIESTQRMNPDSPPVICALFPIIRKRIYGFPISGMEIWKHDLCFDCTPLIRKDCANEVIEYAFKYLSQTLGTKLFSLDTITAEGPMANLLAESNYQEDRAVFYREIFTRASFRPMDSAETFINTKVAKNTRKGTQRLRRKLSQLGDVRTEAQHTYDPETISEFLTLEASGWKGENNTALDCNANTRNFVHEMARRMMDSKKLVLSRTSLDGRAVAMLCEIQNENYGVQFKIAYDETLREYSPGLILELDIIERLHRQGLALVDSCAAPNHSMINRVWTDRLRFQNLVIALDGKTSQFAVSLMPFLQQIKKIFSKKRQTP